jgi:splicing factor 3A subunit 1
LAALTDRESKNPEFDFLKPTHLMFGYFTGLIDSYSKCLVPHKEELVRIQQYIDNPSLTLEIAIDRYEFQKSKMQEERKTKEERDKEEEQEAALIDWHDFVTVEVITFDDEPEPENVRQPPAIDKIRKEVEETEMDFDIDNEESKALDALSKKMEEQVKMDKEEFREPLKREVPVREVAFMREEVDAEGEKMEVEEDIELEPGATIRTDYVRRPEVVDGKQRCPRCNTLIPKEEFERHMRMELASPQYHAQRKNLIDKVEGRSIASGEEIVSNLREFVGQRPDISGDVERQLPSAIKGEIKRPRVIYDGSAGNLTRTTANVAMMAVQQKKNMGLPRDPATMAVELAATTAKKVMNLAAQQQMPGYQPMVQPRTVIPPNPPGAVAAAPVLNPLGFLRPGMDTTLNMQGGLLTIDKYDAASESTLRPEAEWLRNFPGNLTILVRVPNDGGESEWNFVGQILKLSMEPKTTIGQLKRAISSYVGNMPPKKMRLKTYNRNAMKDEFSLAHYNIHPNTTLELSVKERGRRKK